MLLYKHMIVAKANLYTVAHDRTNYYMGYNKSVRGHIEQLENHI
jgi:hypothetical protein